MSAAATPEDGEYADPEARYCHCAEFTPDWDGVSALGRKSVCGRYVFYEFHFLDWEHADGNEERGGRLLTCEQCKAARAK